MEQNTQSFVKVLKQMKLEQPGRGRKTTEHVRAESDDKVFTISSEDSEELDVGGGVSLLSTRQVHHVQHMVDHLQASRSELSDVSVTAEHQIELSIGSDNASVGSKSLASVDEAFEPEAEFSESENDEGFASDADNDLFNDLFNDFGAVQEVIQTQSVTPDILRAFVNDGISPDNAPTVHAQSFPEWFLRKELDWNSSPPRFCCARLSTDKEHPLGTNTIIVKLEDGAYIPRGPGRNGAIVYILPEKGCPQFDNVAVLVELQDGEFMYTGHYQRESHEDYCKGHAAHFSASETWKARSAVEKLSKEQVVDTFSTNIDGYPLGHRLQWIFLRCKAYNLAYLDTLRTKYERRKAVENNSPFKDARGVDAKTVHDEQGYDCEAEWGTADMQEAIAASLLTASSIPSISTRPGYGVQAESSRVQRQVFHLPEVIHQNGHQTTQSQTEVSPADQASIDEWSSWELPPPHEWRERWGGVYGREAPSTNR